MGGKITHWPGLSGKALGFSRVSGKLAGMLAGTMKVNRQENREEPKRKCKGCVLGECENINSNLALS